MIAAICVSFFCVTLPMAGDWVDWLVMLVLPTATRAGGPPFKGTEAPPPAAPIRATVVPAVFVPTDLHTVLGSCVLGRARFAAMLLLFAPVPPLLLLFWLPLLLLLLLLLLLPFPSV
uniref:Uncharacterized protein n=1 Tax=Anopheles darlingi TaxID=43151 RepID=A0A2M4D781_ANODA